MALGLLKHSKEKTQTYFDGVLPTEFTNPSTQYLYEHNAGTVDVSTLLKNIELSWAKFIPVTTCLFTYTDDIFFRLNDNVNLVSIADKDVAEDDSLIDEIIPIIPLKTIQTKGKISKVNYGKIYRPLYDSEEDFLIDG